MLEKVKMALRISHTALDDEINDLIDAARQDLILSGVSSDKANDDYDALIKRAIITYCKAQFGLNNQDSEKYQQSYELLKNHLSLSIDYNSYTVSFTVTDGVNPLEDAVISFNGDFQITNSSGIAVFKGVSITQNMPYKVSLDGYTGIEDSVDVNGNTSITVTMAVI